MALKQTIFSGLRGVDADRRSCPPALDLGVRAGKKVEAVPDAIVDEVLMRLAPIFRIK